MVIHIAITSKVGTLSSTLIVLRLAGQTIEDTNETYMVSREILKLKKMTRRSTSAFRIQFA